MEKAVAVVLTFSCKVLPRLGIARSPDIVCCAFVPTLGLLHNEQCDCIHHQGPVNRGISPCLNIYAFFFPGCRLLSMLVAPQYTAVLSACCCWHIGVCHRTILRHFMGYPTIDGISSALSWNWWDFFSLWLCILISKKFDVHLVSSSVERIHLAIACKHVY